MIMSGLTKKSKSKIVENYIKRVNPYEAPLPIAFDLRGYAAYINENKLKPEDITLEIMQRFSRDAVIVIKEPGL